MASLLRLATVVVVALIVGRGVSGAATGPIEGEVATNSVLTEEELEAALSARGSRGTAETASGSPVSPGSGVVLAEIARELIGRSATSSQVLSLNLTNLVILLVLKAIIFGAGSMGMGWAGHKARSGNENSVTGGLVTEQEMLLGLSFLVDSEGRCLNRVACQEPESAAAYARAGRLLAGGARLLSGVLPSYDNKYDSVLDGLQEAVEYGRNGGRCETRFSCVTT